MVKTSLLHLVIAFFLLSAFQSKGQSRIKSREELEIEAYAALNAQEYNKAYGLFDKLCTKYPEEMDYQEKLGLCCLYYPEKKGRSIEVFTSMRDKYKTPLYEYYLGKAYHINYKFDEALAILEPLVQKLSSSKKATDKAIVADATLGIINCQNGRILVQNKVFADIKNIGGPINTEDYEYVPVITTDESVMYYTYRGKKSVGGKQNFKPGKKTIDLIPDSNGVYTEDIYFSTKNADGNYSEPKPIESINTKGYEAAIAISPDGQTLFTFSSSEADSGDIFMSKLNGETWEPPVRLNSNINTQNYWEGSCSITADGRYLYFASERPGGIGGRDIWMSERGADGDWGPAVNLGRKINTEYDEDAPFIHPDGITLFFSSEAHLSIGGYDIMYSVKKDNDWTDPKSMGIPLNTTEDDNYYVINFKGDKGFFSSNRAGSGGYGNYDIYSVTPGILGEKPIVALVKGTIYGDEKPVEGKIEIVKKSDTQPMPVFHYANKATGKYLMALSPSSIYHIKVTADGFEPMEEDFEIGALDKYMEQNKDFNLFSAAALAAKKARETPVEPAKTETPATVTEQPSKTETSPATEEKKPAETKTKKEKAPKQEKAPKEVTEPKETKETKGSETSASEKGNLTPCTDMLPDFAPFKGKSLNNPEDYRLLLEVAGNYCAQNLQFRIQIGAFRTPGNFKYEHLKKLGKVESQAYPDGLTRFTQKQFTTMRDAEAHRQKLIAKGVKDAWIVVFVDGKRYTLEDFIMVDFLGKTVN